MPARNSRKAYLANSYYHLYNRGVDRLSIFQSQQDYHVFQNYLKEYLLEKNLAQLMQALSNPTLSSSDKERLQRLIRMNNYHGQITLVAYCLMTNHFHLLVKQADENTIDSFMNSLATRYTMYFNRKYHRVGHLYQGVYKAVCITSEPQLLELTRYIHHQAIQNGQMISQPSSLPDYLGQHRSDWLQPQEILAFFSQTNPKLSYRNFVYQQNDNLLTPELTIEES